MVQGCDRQATPFLRPWVYLHAEPGRRVGHDTTYGKVFPNPQSSNQTRVCRLHSSHLPIPPTAPERGHVESAPPTQQPPFFPLSAAARTFPTAEDQNLLPQICLFGPRAIVSQLFGKTVDTKAAQKTKKLPFHEGTRTKEISIHKGVSLYAPGREG